MDKNSKALRYCLFVLVILGMISLLSPASDIDHDGYTDSLVTEGDVLASLPGAMIGLSAVFTRPLTNYTLPRWFLTFLLLPPPITTK